MTPCYTALRSSGTDWSNIPTVPLADAGWLPPCSISAQAQLCYDSENPYLLLYGESGRGKTFLSHCIARELMNSAHSVMYYSAKELFDRLADLRFRSVAADRQGAADPVSSFDPEYLLTSDLLIIDDLGTELPNDFTKSEFFGMLNGRLSAGKGIIISTNLSPQELSDIYSPRIMSRILENFQLLNLFGRDIRIQKRMADSLGHT